MYTHYWKADKAFKLSALQKRLLKLIVADHKGLVKACFNNAKGICFEAVDGEGDDFTVSYTTTSEGYCKTSRYDYDKVVCKALLVLSLNENFNFWSDGITWTGD
jgi:hypothetical protein